MFNVILEMNWFAISITALLLSVIGGVWYTILFGKAYASALGKSYEPKEKPSLIFIIGPFICGIITTITMSILIYALNINSMGNALIFGGLVGLGLLAVTSVNTGINPNIPHPFLYGLISGSYFIVVGLIGSAIIVVMK